jgi:hypothetical protein
MVRKQKHGSRCRFEDKVVTPECHHPSVVIHLNTLFTNFGPEIAGRQAVYLQSREAMT